MSAFGRDLQLTLQAAQREAITRRHAYLTIEHLLYALIHNEDGARILLHSGADVDGLRIELERFFDEDLEAVPGDEDIELMQTLAFHRVVQTAIDHTHTAWHLHGKVAAKCIDSDVTKEQAVLREVALRRRRAACEAEREEEPVEAVEPEEEEEDAEDAGEFPDIILGAKFLACRA